jgi:potassium-transporting ATPase KdpC subunit
MSSRNAPALRQFSAAVRAFLALTVVLGIAYPLVMTGAAQVLFPARADGSLVGSDDGPVGSALIGQSFTVSATDGSGSPPTEDGAPVMEPDPAYFQSRPSAAGAGYDPLSSSASNFGPENPELVRLVRERRAAVAELENVDPSAVPADALLASGSGLDPHISPASADLQVPRIARERALAEPTVRELVAQHTQGRGLGFLGEPAVNVLTLNLALDALGGGGGEGGD